MMKGLSGERRFPIVSNSVLFLVPCASDSMLYLQQNLQDISRLDPTMKEGHEQGHILNQCQINL